MPSQKWPRLVSPLRLTKGSTAIDGRSSRRGRPLQSPSIAFRQADRRRLDLVEERRQVAGGLHLEALPEPDLGDGRPGSCFIEIGRDGLEPSSDGFESLRQRREVLGEDQEQAVADGVEGRRAPLPGSDDLGVEDRPTDVMDLEVALDDGQATLTGPAEEICTVELAEEFWL